MRSIKSALLVLCLISFSAMDGQCPGIGFPPGGNACTLIAVPSVVLNIRNAQGQVVPSAQARFRVGNGPTFTAGCNGDCGSFVLVYETVGTFNIEVSSIGQQPKTVQVGVSFDQARCHPVTKNVTVQLAADTTTAALGGVWRSTSGFFGESILRFGTSGEIIGAILLDRTIAGDGNFYIAYNGRSIRGAPGQQILAALAAEPTRVGNLFTFETTTLSIPVGFSNAVMSADFQTLNGTLGGQPASYRRLSETEIPNAIRDP